MDKIQKMFGQLEEYKISNEQMRQEKFENALEMEFIYAGQR